MAADRTPDGLEMICDGAALAHGDPGRLLVVFSSIMAVQRDRFDYVDITRALPYTRLYLRDHRPLLAYHAGIRGLGGSLHDTAEFLRYFIDRTAPRRVTFMGISIGGYAANLLGHLLAVDDVHLQSTVTFIDPAVRDALGGGERVAGAFDGIATYLHDRGRDPALMDLRRVIAGRSGPRPLVRMYYPAGDAIDTLQARHIADFPHVQAIAHPSRSHNYLAAVLARSGQLYDDLAAPLAALQGPPRDGDRAAG